MGTIFKTLVLLGCGLGALGAPQGDDEILEAVTDTTTTTTADSCSAGSETLDKVLSVLGDMSEVTQLLVEVRRLDRKVLKMGKALKKLGLMEDNDGEFVDPRTTQAPTSTTSLPTTHTTTTTTMTTTTTTDNGPCQDDWHHIGDGCYQVITDQALTWEESRQQCLLQGSDLAEMNDMEEQRVVTEFLNSWHYGIPFWLGGLRNARGKWRWEWTESRIQTGAVKWGWAEEYPRSIDGSNTTSTCLAIRGRGEVGGMKTWEDQPCEEQHHFMCEYLWIQEYLADGAQDKMSRKLEQNLIDVENIRRARQLLIMQ
eukprot:TRINITY_DN3305_c0_g1_i2.p1 TRINITY_DN3305_c0_g1~~TRINITY_DN3305_c0_g1_i2.p1  ORF type:complete len:312 (-),score=89.85 TRINITY_DN3305_c0_g1_i2:79-1014(-)